MTQTRVSPHCAFCGDPLAFWPQGMPATTCKSCRRPLLLIPASLLEPRYRIFSVVDLARIVMLPLIGGAIVAFVTGKVVPGTFAHFVAFALLVYGMLDVWDGTAGLESGCDRVRRRIRNDGAARRVSIGKTMFGSASLALGAVGLIMTS